MIRISYVSNAGSGRLEDIEVAEGTEVGMVLDLKGDGEAVDEGRSVVKINGEAVEFLAQVLKAGDRIVVTPKKVTVG